MKRNTLGIHVITQNEEDLLPVCLESIKDIADEILVIDTGSTDKTTEIARSYGAKVWHVPWQDDFSHPRNVALAQATTDWILYLDADEQLASPLHELRRLLEDLEAEGFFVKIENLIGPEPEDRVVCQSLRLFRRRAEYSFSGRIHEEVTGSILKHHPLSKIKDSTVTLLHCGYLPDVLQRKNKPDRNRTLLLQALAEEPDNPFHLYNLAVTYTQLNRLEEAESAMQQAYQKVHPRAAYRPTLVRDTAKLLFASGRFEEAGSLLKRELEQYPDYTDLYHLLGETLEAQGLLIESLQMYRSGAERGAAPSRYVSEKGIGTYRTLCCLASLTHRLGSPSEAISLFYQALGIAPSYRPALEGVAEAMCDLAIPPQEIAALLRSYLRETNDSHRRLLARVMSQIGAYEEALSLLKELGQRTLEDERLYCECLLQTGQMPLAYDQLGHLLARSQPEQQEHLILDRAICRWSEERSLPYSFYQDVPEASKHLFEQLEGWLLEKKPLTGLSPEVHTLIERLLRRAVQLRLIRLADPCSRLSTAWRSQYAHLLYREGFILLAADILLTQMQDGTLDLAGLQVLAEILFEKQHYEQTAAMLEQILEQEPANQKARTGVAICYLEMARKILRESLERFPGHQTFLNDLDRIDKSIRCLAGMGWRTRWNGAQRRNFHVAVDHFFVHDRQE
jgi:tetratricopeptide (TPR) repeat protein